MSEASGWQQLLVWPTLALIFGGAAMTMLGLLWYKAGRLLNHFNLDASPEKGYKIAMIGFVMLVAGIGMIFLLP